jgi:hypothetical protein
VPALLGGRQAERFSGQKVQHAALVLLVFRWFSLREFFEQVHYLNQFGVELELSKFDLARYYRAFRMLANAIPSHMQLWLDEESPFLIADWRMMFGCRAAANFASRASVFICWLVRFAIEHI